MKQHEQLRKYNRWRRGDKRLKQPDPKKLGELIDSVADRLEVLEREHASLNKLLPLQNPASGGSGQTTKKRGKNKMMNKYTMSRTISARPMARQEYNDLRDWMLPEDENGADEGFLIEDPDGKPNVTGYNGYVTWFPAEEFKRDRKSVV